MKKTIQKAYKYRIYPNVEQMQLMEKTFGCCRYLYNYGLAKIKVAYEADKTIIRPSDIQKEIPLLKADEKTQFLSEVSAIALIYVIRHLDGAFKNFFRDIKKGIKAGYPKFKSKYDRHQSFQFHQGYEVDFENNLFHAPKMKNIKAVFHRRFNGLPKTCTISKTPSGKYFVSILVEEEIDIKIPKKKKELTIHLGLRNFAYLMNSDKDVQIIRHPEFLQKSLERMKILSKRLSKKKNMNKGKEKDDVFKGTNIEKARIKLALLHERIADQRAAFLHNLSADLVKKQGYTTIRVENWDIADMVKNKYVARQIADSGWRTFWSQTAYKSNWGEVEYLQADKKLPSSKQCSECGVINSKLKMQITWTCEVCGTKHNRELNAVKNISAISSGVAAVL